jgi:ribosome-associated protein
MILSNSQIEKLLGETHVSASRSGGPGGQNVNKVNTKIELRFPLISSELFSENEKQLILTKLKNRINSEGELIVTSDSARTQWKNREGAKKKFIGLLEKALTVPKKRRKTQPTAASRLKRAELKKKQAQKKQLRKPPGL